MPVFKNFERHISKKPPDVLYHYTDQAGVIGILDSWELWATKIQYLNDTSELSLALSLAREDLQRIRKGKDRSRYGWFVDALLRGIDTLESVNIFVASFSEERDSLAQWRAYGGRSSGYAVGFRSQDIISLASKNWFVLAKCIYSENQQRAYISDIVKHFVEYGVLIFPPLAPALLNDPKLEQTVIRFENELLRAAPLLKDRNFSIEKEWRIIIDVDSSSENIISFRPGLSMITPYYRMQLPSQRGKKRLCDIVVGPTPHGKYSLASVEMCCKSRGITCKRVVSSTIPFRGW